ncbi:GntR family transcriptional regulator [Caenimonas soli]|uniref:GntR family transcriptional regulator n=1 Tax=Caenimonas soli TaxID=2735555 RepID=UPI001557886C|nr:GntR family transcriptional regulator [Caenimonas soli]NPC58552.1 GntR family transcriptional regulator [Caenimonas soli]
METEIAGETRVYDAIVDAILSHRLAPGTQLKERELAQLFGVGRESVRGALTRLGHSLLVELRPNRSAVIADPSPAEARDLFEARRVIESAIVRSLARDLTPERGARLSAFSEEEQRAYASGDLKTAHRLSIQFHSFLAELAGNSVLENVMQQIICRMPLLVLARVGPGAEYCGAHEHRAVIEALLRRDEEAAVNKMLEHLQGLEKRFGLNKPELPGTLAETFNFAKLDAAKTLSQGSSLNSDKPKSGKEGN